MLLADSRPSAVGHRVVLLVTALVLLQSAACGLMPAGPTQIRVNAETLPWVDIAGYRTYGWWQPPLDQRAGCSEREALLDWRVRNAVDGELGTRGYTQATAGKPDFVVRYGARLREQSSRSFQDYLAYRADGGGKDMGDAFMGYDVGSLTLELMDVATRRVAWRATASAVIEDQPSGKLIDPAVAKMLERFPPARR